MPYSVTADLFPSTGVNSEAEGGTANWTAPHEAVSDNGVWAHIGVVNGTTNKALSVSGFTFTSVPTTSIVTGISMTCQRSLLLDTDDADMELRDGVVRIVNDYGTSSNLASGTIYPSAVVGTFNNTARNNNNFTWTYGGPTELWGLPKCNTAATFLSNFELRFQNGAPLNKDVGANFGVDYFSIKVYHTEIRPRVYII